jgi:hypothetical protein
MQFSNGRPDLIRAINQRWLLKFWKRVKGEQSVPSWQAVEAEDLSRVSANLSFLHVAAGERALRFQIISHGATIGQVYGSADCRGKYLDEVLPPNACGDALSPFQQTAISGHPVYTVHDVTDCKGRVVHFERLLLPFSRAGATVDRILASFEFICADGAYDGRDLMKTQAAPPTLRLSANIVPGTLT